MLMAPPSLSSSIHRARARMHRVLRRCARGRARPREIFYFNLCAGTVQQCRLLFGGDGDREQMRMGSIGGRRPDG